ncbi:putative RNA polymerase sigma factor FecI [compost metagenome]
MQLDRLLDGLPPKARAAFLLSQLDGLTYPEIAERLDVSLSLVQQHMVRAMSACYAAIHA